jgi:hypothetical protein
MKVVIPKFGRIYYDESIKTDMLKPIIGQKQLSTNDYETSIQTR